MTQTINLETRFTEHLKTLENEIRSIRENMQIISSGKGRTGHFNKISENIQRMKETLLIIKRLNLRDEAINDQINKKIKETLDNAIKSLKEKDILKETNIPQQTNEMRILNEIRITNEMQKMDEIQVSSNDIGVSEKKLAESPVPEPQSELREVI